MFAKVPAQTNTPIIPKITSPQPILAEVTRTSGRLCQYRFMLLWRCSSNTAVKAIAIKSMVKNQITASKVSVSGPQANAIYPRNDTFPNTPTINISIQAHPGLMPLDKAASHIKSRKMRA